MSGSFSGLSDFKLESFEDCNDLDSFARPDGLDRFGLPELAVDEDFAGGGEVGPGRPCFADHPFPPGEGAAAVRLENEGEEEQDDQGQGHDDRQDVGQARPELGDGGLDEHERTDDHGGDPSDGQHAEALDLDLEDEEDDGQEDKAQADIVDGQDLEGENGQEKGDASQDARQNGPGMGEFEEQPQEPDHEQDVGQVGVGDGQEDLLPEGHG